MIPTYVINLDHRTDRLARIGADLDAAGVAWQRLPAVNGAAVAPATLDANGPADGPMGPISAGARACTASHVAAWQRLLDGPAPAALVLEDDAEIAPDLTGLLADAGWIAPGIHLIKIEKFNAERPSRLLLGARAMALPVPGRALRRMYSRHTGTGGYIITRAGAQIALARRGGIAVPIDHWLFNDTVSPLWPALRPALVTPAPLRQRRADASDIAGPPGPPRPTGLRLRRGWAELSRLPVHLALLASGRARLMRHIWAERPD